MIIPTLIYSFFLFLKLGVRFGLTRELVSAWPLWIGVAAGVNFYRLEKIIKRYNFYNLYPGGKDESISQNILFAAGWAVVGLFGMTSTIGFLGKGVVLGVGLQLAIKVGKDLVEINEKINLRPERLDWFYLPIKRQLTDREKKWGGLIFLVIFAGLSFF